MIDTVLSFIPIEFRGPSIITVILILWLLYIIKTQGNIIKRQNGDIIKLRSDFESAENGIKESINNLNKNMAEMKVLLKTMIDSQTDIKQDIRDIRNKRVK